MQLDRYLNHDIVCTCGRTHRCDIAAIEIGSGALASLPSHLEAYSHILLVADDHTFAVAGKQVQALLGNKLAATILPKADAHLIPDERAIEAIETALPENADFILGVGSGVVNDLCKYVSFHHKLPCGIVATAPSMDGYASSGAAMILNGMKVTETTHAPSLILGDSDILAAAPIDMIRAGYADIIGKYSALCDWKLSALVNGEAFCPFIYELVYEKTNRVRALAKEIAARNPDAIRELAEALVLIGACLTLSGSTRPGSGSEHHLSHYFEITGLLRHEPYFCHGIDVGYATIVTARIREKLCTLDAPSFAHPTHAQLDAEWTRIYGKIAPEVCALQEKAGRYAAVMDPVYVENWQKIRDILAECPTGDEIEAMLLDVGFDLSAFASQYGRDKILDGVWFAKDLKDRYTVLWLFFDIYYDRKELLTMKSQTCKMMHEVALHERNMLDKLYQEMDLAEYAKAIEILKKSTLTVTSACGSSGFAAQKFAHSLCCIERPAKFVSPAEAIHGGMGALQPQNAMIILSHGGKSEELLPLRPIVKEKNAKLIAITANPDSALGQAADAILLIPEFPESDKYHVMATASFTATCTIFDALMIGLMEEDDYQLEQFAVIHPGGAVGKQIN